MTVARSQVIALAVNCERESRRWPVQWGYSGVFAVTSKRWSSTEVILTAESAP